MFPEPEQVKLCPFKLILPVLTLEGRAKVINSVPPPLTIKLLFNKALEPLVKRIKGICETPEIS